MFRLVFLLSVVAFAGANWRKCCPETSVLTKFTSIYNCSESSNSSLRKQVVASASPDQGSCVDFENDDVLLLRDENGTFSKIRDLNVVFFPKCCPLNYFYNSTSHGCVKSQSPLELFFNESFVKVGLSHCDVIQDLKVDSKTPLVADASLHLSTRKIDKGNFCVDKDMNNLFIIRECRNDYDVCKSIKCVHKCCPDGQSFINGSNCYDTFTHGLDFRGLQANMDNVDDQFAIIYGFTPSIYALTPPGRFQFHLDKQGVFTMSEKDISLGNINLTKTYDLEEESYCIEHALKSTLNEHIFFRKFSELTIQIKFLYTRIAMAISIFFLVITIFYYCVSNEKRTVFGKTLICFCATAAINFIILDYLAFVRRPTDNICNVLMYVILYASLSVFTWMNIMCIDIYWTFGSPTSFTNRQIHSREIKRFLFYCIYGWGTPMLLIGLELILHYLDVLPEYAKLVVDPEKCFVKRSSGQYGQFFFSSIPIAILVICNLILFIKTARYCLNVKKEISRMNDSNVLKGEKNKKFNHFKDRFGLLLRLFLIMGISFLFDVISCFYSFKNNETTAIIETVWDTFNCLLGLFIFLIFIAKRRIFEKCKAKLGLTKLRKVSVVSSGVTQTTTVSNLGTKDRIS